MLCFVVVVVDDAVASHFNSLIQNRKSKQW